RLVQRSFRRAGFLRWNHLGASQISFQKLVRNDQATVLAAIEQMMTTGEPEIALLAHRRARSTSSTRSVCSGGAVSSPTISTKLKTGAGFALELACRVRNDSRITSFSKRRDTATNIPGGCSQRDAAKAISSSAASRAVSRSGAPQRSTSP